MVNYMHTSNAVCNGPLFYGVLNKSCYDRDLLMKSSIIINTINKLTLSHSGHKVFMLCRFHILNCFKYPYFML